MNAPDMALSGQDSKVVGSLYVAFELGDRSWRLALGDGVRAPSQCTVSAGDTEAVLKAIAKAKARCHLCNDAPVRSCYEAGRDGFWLHRWASAQGIANLVVDPASIEVSRRARRAKTDRLDADRLLTMLIRYYAGERRLWAIARIPSPEQEDERRVHRELGRLRQERTAHSNRIRSLLVLHNLRTERIGGRTWVDWWAAHKLNVSSSGSLSSASRSGRLRQCRLIRCATAANRPLHCWLNWRASARAVHGLWSRSCSDGGSFAIAANSPAVWVWRRRHMQAAPVKSSRVSARRATSGCGG
jgi:hypothetical protein